MGCALLRQACSRSWLLGPASDRTGQICKFQARGRCCLSERKKGPEEGHVRSTSGLHIHMHVCAPPPHKHACRKIHHTPVNPVKAKRGENPVEEWSKPGRGCLTGFKGKRVPISHGHWGNIKWHQGAACGGFLKGFTKIVVVGATVTSRFSMEMK